MLYFHSKPLFLENRIDNSNCEIVEFLFNLYVKFIVFAVLLLNFVL